MQGFHDFESARCGAISIRRDSNISYDGTEVYSIPLFEVAAVAHNELAKSQSPQRVPPDAGTENVGHLYVSVGYHRKLEGPMSMLGLRYLGSRSPQQLQPKPHPLMLFVMEVRPCELGGIGRYQN